jgi:hypothetical protein
MNKSERFRVIFVYSFRISRRMRLIASAREMLNSNDRKEGPTLRQLQPKSGMLRP